MTKNRARKRAARQRVALTGERYVVAQRAAAEAPTPTPRASRARELTRRVPGVPSHVDRGLQAAAPRGRNSHASLQQRAGHDQPRVLVAWQTWIAGRVRVGSRSSASE